jgi:hypothetical protein
VEDFLRLILPSEGWYVAAIKTDRGLQHIWTQDVAALAAGIHKCAAAGFTVYHACAAFAEAGTAFSGRKQKNVRAVKALWADVDCGEGKPYPDALAGAQAVVAFCGAASLPLPQFVNSGYGVHVYWPLASDLLPDAWRVYAAGLRVLAQRHGLEVDPTRTEDCVSILRPPGSFNRKGGSPRPVTTHALIQPLALEQFTELHHAGSEDISVPRVQSPRANSVCADILAGNEPDAYLIAERCGQFGSFVHAVRGDRLPEPIWRLDCALASFTRQGDAFAHEHSKIDERYSEAETQSKIDNYRRESSGAPLCSTFHKHRPATCEGCPSFGKINSPVALGYGERKQPDGAPPLEDSVPAGGGDREGVGSRLQQVTMPLGYVWGNNNELVLATSLNGKPVDYVISVHPIYLDSVQVGEASGEFQLVYQQFLPQEGWRELLIPAATMQTSEAFASLSERGGNIKDKKLFLDYTRAAVDAWHAQNRLKMNYEQYGWKENFTAFLFGDRLYTKDDVIQISGNKELRARNKLIGPQAGHELSDWQARAEPLFSHGTEAQAVAVCAGFAAPLVALLSNEGGVVLAFVSQDTGKGKSVALIGASSVWGRREGLEIKREYSNVARSITMATLGNLPVIFDEMRARDPKVLRDFIKLYTEGGDKVRAQRDGTLRHASTEWQNFMLTADNVSLVDLVSEYDDVDDPCAMRIIELPCSLPQDMRHVYGDRLKVELNKFSGVAGHVYLKWLVENVEPVRELLHTYYQHIYRENPGWD